MGTNDFDRSDFNELLDYTERFSQEVEKVQEKTVGFCDSFNSGIKGISKGLTQLRLTGLVDVVDKAQGGVSHLNDWVVKAGNNLTGVWVANAQAAVSGMASMSEMAYSVLDTMASLEKLKELKITTNADENKRALEGVVGTGERMQRLFGELQAIPLLKNMGVEKDVFGKLRSKWDVLQNSKENVAGLMTTYGKARGEVGQFREGWRTIRDDKNHSLKGFGGAVGAIFKKKEEQPGEEGEKKGFFSIFRKKEEGDKNWFSAVAARFSEFKERTQGNLKERFTPLVNYGTRVAESYSPLYGMAKNAMNFTQLSGDLGQKTRLTWLKAADGFGVGDKQQNQEKISKISQQQGAWDNKMQEKSGKVDDWQNRISETMVKANHLVGNEDIGLSTSPPEQKELTLQEGMSAPAMNSGMETLFSGNSSGSPVTVNVERLVENLNITPADLKEGLEEVRELVISELSRILNNANNLALQ